MSVRLSATGPEEISRPVALDPRLRLLSRCFLGLLCNLRESRSQGFPRWWIRRSSRLSVHRGEPWCVCTLYSTCQAPVGLDVFSPPCNTGEDGARHKCPIHTRDQGWQPRISVPLAKFCDKSLSGRTAQGRDGLVAEQGSQGGKRSKRRRAPPVPFVIFSRTLRRTFFG